MDETNVMFDLNYFKYCFLKATGIDFHELRLEQDFCRLAKDLVEDSPPAIEGAITSADNKADAYLIHSAPSLQGRAGGESSSPFFLYRDFQARNVMLDAAGNPYFIDFQGGRKGPVYYDLASFLWQASARYPQALRDELIEVYRESLDATLASIGLPPLHFSYSTFHKFVLFRLLQVLGAYGFRGYFERKQHFLDSIPPALDNIRDLLQEEGSCPYPELRKVLKKITDSPPALPAREGAITSVDNKADACLEHSAPSLTGRAGGESRAGESRSLTVRIFSFSYKRGIPEDESGNGGGYVFDCRSTHNPGRYEPYKQLTGLDEAVIRFLEDDGEIITFLDSVYRLADHHVERYLQRGFTDLMFSFGCTGGQHRSVYCAQHLAEHLNRKYGIRIDLTHREQNIHTILPAAR